MRERGTGRLSRFWATRQDIEEARSEAPFVPDGAWIRGGWGPGAKALGYFQECDEKARKVAGGKWCACPTMGADETAGKVGVGKEGSWSSGDNCVSKQSLGTRDS